MDNCECIYEALNSVDLRILCLILPIHNWKSTPRIFTLLIRIQNVANLNVLSIVKPIFNKMTPTMSTYVMKNVSPIAL